MPKKAPTPSPVRRPGRPPKNKTPTSTPTSSATASPAPKRRSRLLSTSSSSTSTSSSLTSARFNKRIKAEPGQEEDKEGMSSEEEVDPAADTDTEDAEMREHEDDEEETSLRSTPPAKHAVNKTIQLRKEKAAKEMKELIAQLGGPKDSRADRMHRSKAKTFAQLEEELQDGLDRTIQVTLTDPSALNEDNLVAVVQEMLSAANVSLEDVSRLSFGHYCYRRYKTASSKRSRYKLLRSDEEADDNVEVGYYCVDCANRVRTERHKLMCNEQENEAVNAYACMEMQKVPAFNDPKRYITSRHCFPIELPDIISMLEQESSLERITFGTRIFIELQEEKRLAASISGIRESCFFIKKKGDVTVIALTKEDGFETATSFINDRHTLRHEVYNSIEDVLLKHKTAASSLADVSGRSLLLFGEFLMKGKPSTLTDLLKTIFGADVVIKKRAAKDSKIKSFAVAVFESEDELKKAYVSCAYHSVWRSKINYVSLTDYMTSPPGKTAAPDKKVNSPTRNVAPKKSTPASTFKKDNSPAVVAKRVASSPTPLGAAAKRAKVAPVATNGNKQMVKQAVVPQKKTSLSSACSTPSTSVTTTNTSEPLSSTVSESPNSSFYKHSSGSMQSLAKDLCALCNNLITQNKITIAYNDRGPYESGLRLHGSNQAASSNKKKPLLFHKHCQAMLIKLQERDSVVDSLELYVSQLKTEKIQLEAQEPIETEMMQVRKAELKIELAELQANSAKEKASLEALRKARLVPLTVKLDRLSNTVEPEDLRKFERWRKEQAEQKEREDKTIVLQAKVRELEDKLVKKDRSTYTLEADLSRVEKQCEEQKQQLAKQRSGMSTGDQQTLRLLQMKVKANELEAQKEQERKAQEIDKAREETEKVKKEKQAVIKKYSQIEEQLKKMTESKAATQKQLELNKINATKELSAKLAACEEKEKKKQDSAARYNKNVLDKLQADVRDLQNERNKTAAEMTRLKQEKIDLVELAKNAETKTQQAEKEVSSKHLELETLRAQAVRSMSENAKQRQDHDSIKEKLAKKNRELSKVQDERKEALITVAAQKDSLAKMRQEAEATDTIKKELVERDELLAEADRKVEAQKKLTEQLKHSLSVIRKSKQAVAAGDGVAPVDDVMLQQVKDELKTEKERARAAEKEIRKKCTMRGKELFKQMQELTLAKKELESAKQTAAESQANSAKVEDMLKEVAVLKNENTAAKTELAAVREEEAKKTSAAKDDTEALKKEMATVQEESAKKLAAAKEAVDVLKQEMERLKKDNMSKEQEQVKIRADNARLEKAEAAFKNKGDEIMVKALKEDMEKLTKTETANKKRIQDLEVASKDKDAKLQDIHAVHNSQMQSLQKSKSDHIKQITDLQAQLVSLKQKQIEAEGKMSTSKNVEGEMRSIKDTLAGMEKEKKHFEERNKALAMREEELKQKSKTAEEGHANQLADLRTQLVTLKQKQVQAESNNLKYSQMEEQIKKLTESKAETDQLLKTKASNEGSLEKLQTEIRELQKERSETAAAMEQNISTYKKGLHELTVLKEENKQLQEEKTKEIQKREEALKQLENRLIEKEAEAQNVQRQHEETLRQKHEAVAKGQKLKQAVNALEAKKLEESVGAAKRLTEIEAACSEQRERLKKAQQEERKQCEQVATLTKAVQDLEAALAEAKKPAADVPDAEEVKALKKKVNELEITVRIITSLQATPAPVAPQAPAAPVIQNAPQTPSAPQAPSAPVAPPVHVAHVAPQAPVTTTPTPGSAAAPVTPPTTISQELDAHDAFMASKSTTSPVYMTAGPAAVRQRAPPAHVASTDMRIRLPVQYPLRTGSTPAPTPTGQRLPTPQTARRVSEPPRGNLHPGTKPHPVGNGHNQAGAAGGGSVLQQIMMGQQQEQVLQVRPRNDLMYGRSNPAHVPIQQQPNPVHVPIQQQPNRQILPRSQQHVRPIVQQPTVASPTSTNCTTAPTARPAAQHSPLPEEEESAPRFTPEDIYEGVVDALSELDDEPAPHVLFEMYTEFCLDQNDIDTEVGPHATDVTPAIVKQQVDRAFNEKFGRIPTRP